jgi:hypothetical protein
VTPSRFNSGLETDALITGLRKQIPGCDVQFNFLPNEQPLEYVRQIVDREASVGALHGLIVLGCPHPVHEYVLEKKLPAIVFGGVYPTAANLPSVDVDQHAIGFHAAHWLLKQGHRRIALLAREVWLPGDNRLVDGVNEAMAAARLSQGALVIRSVPLDGPAIGMEIVQLMQEADPPTAFICRSPRFVPVVRRTFELLHMTRPPQIIVDREAGQYLGHVTTVLLEDGKTIIAVYPKGHGRGAIVMKRSTDGGLTWSGRLPTPGSWATSQEVPTIYRTVDKSGKKRLIMFSGLYPIRQAVSEDDGATWTELTPIGDFGGIVAMGSCVRLNSGDYLAMFHDDGRYIAGKTAKRGDKNGSPKFTLYQTLSADGGLTWSAPRAIAQHPQAHLCEPGIVRSPDGKQLAVLLRENSRKLNSFVIFSNDEGQTWSEPRELPAALTGDRHTAKYLPDGRLFITFRDTTRQSPTKGDWVAWLGHYDDIVKGTEGICRIRLMKNNKDADCCYPGLELLPDSTVVTTTYGHWTPGEMPYIVSVRFKPQELDAKLKAGQVLQVESTKKP